LTVKLINYRLITASPVATSTDPLFTRGRELVHRLLQPWVTFTLTLVFLRRRVKELGAGTGQTGDQRPYCGLLGAGRPHTTNAHCTPDKI